MPSPAFAQSQFTTAPDNSGQNKQHGLTADEQSDRKSDLAITRKIRKAVIADKSLSMYAHNVKIITRHGTVTLRGPVASEDEKQTVANKAEAVVGSADKVRNQLTVETAGK
ncbi:MAG TPA: BON domain-containing protein [Acidobacteriaceae bacterium]|nr:BON domain-containing protein [Acidobacteriaceae bacterium]